MRIPPLVKNMLKFLPVLAVLAAAVLGLLIGEDLYPASLASQSETPAQVVTEPNIPQPLIVPGEAGQCLPSAVFTSLPPKCRTLEGKLIPLWGWEVEELPPNILATPPGK
jgi:hypothetical protein